jgi:signal transduction histidine kinase
MKHTLLSILLVCGCLFVQGQSDKLKTNSWAETKRAKKGSIIIRWYESKPFIWNEIGQMRGIEHEIVQGFEKFLKDKHKVDLTIQWIEGEDFANTFTTISQETQKGVLGVSAFSRTPERMELVDFAPPYMSDITVLITSKNIPIVKNVYEFDETFSKLTAITIKGTTYEKDLLTIKKERQVDFAVRYIPSSKNILRTIRDTVNAFGFIDLPIYLMELNKNPGMDINRQNLYPINREGYSFIYPKGSDWSEPLREYFESPGFKPLLEDIIGRHFDNSVYEFIENLFLHSDDDVMLLTREKEIQQRDLAGKNKQIEEETILRNFLIAGVIIVLFFLIIIYYQFQKRIKANKILSDQKEKIEHQRMTLKEQNDKLIHLNEEKNNLIKILAHDMRAPINHVQGLAQIFLLENNSLPADQKDIINKIIDSSVRLSAMIGKILDVDAIEGQRVNLIMETIDLPVLLKKAASSFDKLAARKNIRLETKLDTTGLTMQGDVVFLTEIIENVISNAIKFSPAGKSILISASGTNDFVKMCVKDEGPGLTQDDKDKLFQKFQRLSAQPTDGERSTGLGLSIVKKYTEIMNGKVWCDSEFGKGATFCVEFPKSTT